MKNSFKPILLGTLMLFVLSSCSKKDNLETETPTFTGQNPNPINLSVRVIYLVPSDRMLNQAYTDATANCISQLATWYKTTLGTNKTFHINSIMVVETMQSTHNAAWFNAQNGNTGDAMFYFYANAKNDTKALLGNGYDESKYTYLVYVDAQGTTGAGALGFTAMPENDLLGLTGKMSEPVSRWIGGAGHELGHAFGMSHPTNTDPQALMSTGYTIWPKSILLDADKAVLNTSKFLY